VPTQTAAPVLAAKLILKIAVVLASLFFRVKENWKIRVIEKTDVKTKSHSSTASIAVVLSTE
jgi:hypothetical protein